MKRFLLWGVTLAMVSLPDLCVAQTGAAYRVVGNSIRVTRASEWNNWIFQNDLVSSLNVPLSEADVVRVETDGMRPVLFQREINVILRDHFIPAIYTTLTINNVIISESFVN